MSKSKFYMTAAALFLLMLTACADNTNTAEVSETSVTAETTTSQTETETTTTTEEITAVTDENICSKISDSFITGSELLQPPYIDRTIDNLPSEWTENDIITAWKMTEASNVYNEYTDRIFLDLDFDQNFEMILTSYSTEEMYLFEKKQNDIILLDSTSDIDITNGYVFIPPTDEENICEHEVYDFQECRDFNFKTIKNNIYISGISWRSGLGKTCWIKEVKLEDGKIIFSDLYRWGEFRTGEKWNFNFEYRKYEPDGTFELVHKKEIDDFLNQLI